MLKKNAEWISKHSRQILVSSLVLALVGFSTYAATFSGSFRKCVSHRLTDYRREEGRQFFPTGEVLLVCEGVTLDENGELVTALATVALVISTILLWIATREADRTNRISANAAKAAAEIAERSLTDLEGPFLFPVILTNDIFSLLRPFRVYDHFSSPHNPARPTIEFTFKNYGRTPALPLNMSAVFFIGDGNDRRGDPLGNSFIIETLIGPGDSAAVTIERNMQDTIDTWDDYRTVMAGTSRIFFKGAILFSDIFGNRYEQTFCLSWSPIRDGFVVWNPQMNRRRRILGSESSG
jgi:hypothetical protein